MSVLWRILSMAALVASAVILIFSILSVRKESRVRPGLDLLRLGVTLATTVLMARLLGVTTSEALMGLGLLVGLAARGLRGPASAGALPGPEHLRPAHRAGGGGLGSGGGGGAGRRGDRPHRPGGLRPGPVAPGHRPGGGTARGALADGALGSPRRRRVGGRRPGAAGPGRGDAALAGAPGRGRRPGGGARRHGRRGGRGGGRGAGQRQLHGVGTEPHLHQRDRVPRWRWPCRWACSSSRRTRRRRR